MDPALLPLPVVLPIGGAVLAPLLSRLSPRAPMVVSLLALGGASAILLTFATDVYAGQLQGHAVGHVGPVDGAQLGITVTAEPFGLTYALLTATIGTLLLLYSLSELGGLGAHEAGWYACLAQLLLAAMIGTALTADLLNLFVWFEVAALASYGLAGFFLERPWALEATFKMMVLTNLAGFFVFVATALLYSRHGALNLGQLQHALTGNAGRADLVALALLLAGFGTKAGLMPFHGWLADAHSAAPGPVSAMFSGLMVNLGVVAIARVALDVYAVHRTALPGILLVLGPLSAIAGAALALGQDDLKRLLAYDTVSQMGVLLTAVGAGSLTAVTGFVYHLVDHALFKTLLFLCAGAIVHATGMTRLSQMGGLARHRPLTTAAFLLGTASIAGVPPLNGYASLGLIHDALRSDHPAAFVAVLLAQVLTVAALGRATYLAFFRRRDDEYDPLERTRPGALVAFGVLAVGCVAFGVLPRVVVNHVAAPAAAVLLDQNAYAAAALAGHATVTVTTPAFQYFAPEELLIAIGCIVAGVLLCGWYVRRPEPRSITFLRRLHTGSVNDYAAYSIAGLLTCAAVLLTGG
ncbi:proton-conducting transporter membrane subunit [Kribbella jejuensis]|uniref:Membrane bound hydrogenase subunit mbhH n=1 Tax=Kribbella jejuensis TaxID=236068 RepID=A0A542EL72_9ACTN|nr:proton-conducting transporter membrane subunit [Kribbella jejuensis]TQJ16098.1 Membrane bound hydrogenase subunit mbhH [Kribbella jejuensis]